MPLEVSAVAAAEVFRLYSCCQGDPHTYVLDLRPQKEFKKSHLMLAYSIRLTADEKALLVSVGPRPVTTCAPRFPH